MTTVLGGAIGEVVKTIEFREKIAFLTQVYGSRERAIEVARQASDLSLSNLRSLAQSGRTAQETADARILTIAMVRNFEVTKAYLARHRGSPLASGGERIIAEWEGLFLSNDVYNPTSQTDLLPSGYARMSQGEADRAGLTTFSVGGSPVNMTLVDNSTGFYSAIYRTPDGGRYILAFRGSEGLDRLDWSNNISAYVLGDSAQYRQGVSVARTVSANATERGFRLSYTGHSLGGGLATVAALATNRMAYVYNPAPMTNALLSNLGIDRRYESNVKSLIVDGEFIQRSRLGFYPGQPRILVPARYRVTYQRSQAEVETYPDPMNYRIGAQAVFQAGNRHLIDAVMASRDLEALPR